MVTQRTDPKHKVVATVNVQRPFMAGPTRRTGAIQRITELPIRMRGVGAQRPRPPHPTAITSTYETRTPLRVSAKEQNMQHQPFPA